MANKSRIAIASDHAGVELKAALQKSLPEWEWIDLGPINGDRVDYPDFAEVLGHKISSGEAKQGILICGSGIGMSISANKIPGIRAALVDNTTAAKLSREHNDANVLCLGSRFVAPEYGTDIARAWLETPFSGDERHLKRLAKVTQLEKKAGNSK